MKLSIVIPCFNEAQNIELFYASVVESLSAIEAMDQDMGFELVFINDGSKDETLETLHTLANSTHTPAAIPANITLKIIDFSRNFGKEAAMYAGLKASSGDCVAIIDADLQHPPALLIDMFAKWKNGEAETIYAKRISRAGDGAVRSKLSEWFYVLCNFISEVPLESGVGDFRLMDRMVVDAVLSMSEYHRFSKAMFEWVGFSKIGLEYENIPRAKGSSGWGFWKLFKYSIDGLVNFSATPLRIAFVLGFVMSFLSLFYGLYAVIDMMIFHNAVRGWTTLVALIVFLGGVQLIILGIMGEYIARIYEQVKHRPLYIENRKTQHNTP